MRASAGALVALVLLPGCAIGPAIRYHEMSEDWQRAEPAGSPADPRERLFEGQLELDRGELLRPGPARNPKVQASRGTRRGGPAHAAGGAGGPDRVGDARAP